MGFGSFVQHAQISLNSEETLLHFQDFREKEVAFANSEMDFSQTSSKAKRSSVKNEKR